MKELLQLRKHDRGDRPDNQEVEDVGDSLHEMVVNKLRAVFLSLQSDLDDSSTNHARKQRKSTERW